MAAALFIVFLVTLIGGMPIALTLAAGGVAAIAYDGSIPIFVAGQKLFTSIDSFTLMAIPFFMLAGALMSSGGISKRLVGFADACVGWMPGGLGVVTIFACMLFGALSGSPTATAAAIGSVMLPSLKKAGYDIKFSLSTIGAAGILGCIIPPSTVMINYASVTEVSIGDMFAGGLLPGILLGVAMMVVAIWYGVKNKIPRTKFSLHQLKEATIHSIGALLMPVIILGGIYGGIFTPTESAAIACVYGFVVGIFIYKELKLKELREVILSAAASSGMVMFIVSSAGVFGYVMAREQIPAIAANFLISVSGSYIVFLLLINILLMIVGCFLETTAAILILAPILYPVLAAYNINPVHFGIVMCINLAIGMLTPPLGVNLYVAAGLDNQPVETVINKYLISYIIIMFTVLLILTYIPGIVMFLPNIL
jgi:C4-dicarboxylate transporter DctM subunit